MSLKTLIDKLRQKIWEHKNREAIRTFLDNYGFEGGVINIQPEGRFNVAVYHYIRNGGIAKTCIATCEGTIAHALASKSYA